MKAKNNRETAKKYFSSRASSYLKEYYGDIGEIYPALQVRHRYIMEMIGEAGGLALDAGCGSGALLTDLHSCGVQGLGFDFSPEMLNAARANTVKGSGEKVPLVLSDLEAMPFRDDSFDLITCAGVIEYLGNDTAALEEMSRVLRKGGVALISVTNASTPLWLIETVFKIVGIWGFLHSFLTGGKLFPNTRVHVPYRFSKKAALQGLTEVDRAYFHFSPLPFPLDYVFKGFSRGWGLKMEALSRSPWGFLGRGCVLKFINESEHSLDLVDE